MKPAPSFDSTPEFQNFTDVMRRLVRVPKAELDEAVKNQQQQRKSAKAKIAPTLTPKAQP